MAYPFMCCNFVSNHYKKHISKMMTLRGYFSRHVDILRSNGKETTALNYWSKYLGGQAGKFRLSAITEEWVRGYLRWLYARGNLKPSSINFYFRCVCALYGYAVKEKLISPVRNPFAGLCPTVPPTCKRTFLKPTCAR